LAGNRIDSGQLIDLYREAGEEAEHQSNSPRVGIHALGYVADTDQQAADEFFPGYARSFTEIGRERGWGLVTRSHYDALRSATGAMLVSEPERVAEKILAFDGALGGISRLKLQMSIASLPHSNRMRAIELLGTKVVPLVRGGIRREVLVS
jgi:alkanesulfonate monooxygenase SsuD/methylene tetrahydromethanopterin reductase-like flavin-dependent oxidoreductase (luciferase family)